MKQLLKCMVLSVVLGCICLGAHSQEETAPSAVKLPKWVSNKGYWVVVGNIHRPAERTIYFYNNGNEEVYKETVMGTKFRLNKRKTQLHIKKVLETVVVAWERKQPVTENKNFFAARNSR